MRGEERPLGRSGLARSATAWRNRRNEEARCAGAPLLHVLGLGGCDQALPILNIFVLQTGHVPSVAGLPFFIVIGLGPDISLLTRHFRQ